MHLNTGGLHPRGGHAEYRLLLNNLQQTHSDIYSINEHCLDTSQPSIKKDLYEAGKITNKYSTQYFGSSSETFPNTYKPGGTMLGTTGKISGRLEANGTDTKGRWTWVQLTGKKHKKVLVVSAYRVSQSYPREAGYSTAYMQQYRAYIKENVSKPKPKHKFLVDLASFLLA